MSPKDSPTSEKLQNTLSQIVYVSTPTSEFRLEQLPALIDAARRKNARLSVTGLLIFSNDSFFQVIEGHEDTLDALYQEIRQDPRHTEIVTIAHEPISARSFSEWNLKFSDIHSEALGELDEDLLHFVDGPTPMIEIGKGRARKLIQAFEAGKWRQPTGLAGGTDKVRSSTDHFSMAFQPIVDAVAREVYSHEALVRGPGGEPAYTVLNQLSPEQAAAFDLQARNRAVRMAADLRLDTALNLNFMPSAVIQPESRLELTIEVARECGFPEENLIFEATEADFIKDLKGFSSIVKASQRFGFELAIDDFGAGHAGLTMLAEFQPEYLKLDMGLVRDVESKGPRQAIARAVAGVCEELGMNLVVEGVETIAEYRWFRQLGVRLFQGYLFAKPMFEGRPLVRFPNI